MHPGPMNEGIEISNDIAHGGNSVIEDQVTNGVAVRMASEIRVKAVILEAPYTSTVDVGQAAYFFLPVRLLMYDRFPSIDLIGRIQVPLLLIHGEADNIIPLRFGRRLFETAKKPKEAHFIAGAGHNDLFEHGLTDIELNFLARLPREASGLAPSRAPYAR